MIVSELEEVIEYFHEYKVSEDGRKFFHKENDNFHIIITPNNELYQLDTDHEVWGIELETIEDLKVRFKSFTGENLEEVSREWE